MAGATIPAAVDGRGLNEAASDATYAAFAAARRARFQLP
jgi:hypothetical protein